jgi:hypothetical protein
MDELDGIPDKWNLFLDDWNARRVLECERRDRCTFSLNPAVEGFGISNGLDAGTSGLVSLPVPKFSGKETSLNHHPKYAPTWRDTKYGTCTGCL